MWRDVIEYKGLYKINTRGDIYAYPKRGFNKGGLLKPHPQKGGYTLIVLSKDGVRTTYGVHVLVATAFLDKPVGNVEVNHKDGNKQNNCLSNLEWVTSHYNAQHAVVMGLTTRVLPLEVQENAKALKQNGLTGRQIATELGISEATVSWMLNNKWRVNTHNLKENQQL